ncbi:MAG TPA: beta-eliminating lyase-related protein [Ktedonobacterales bacterium]|nr:beta-eliminating lyase-related protein [Ktedonobacterales bacterium]
MVTEPTHTETTEPAEPVISPDEEAERRAVYSRCERFLGGHGPSRPHAMLAALAATTDPDEQADRYGEGELIEQFEREVADLLGKEAAVFMPSGTMAQQIALRIWSERKRRHTVGFHPTCHLEIHEQKAYQALHGLTGRLIGNPHQVITLDDVKAVHEPLAALLLELPQREIGGQLPGWDDLEAQSAWARERNIAMHMDGARLWESAPYYERSYAEIAALFDTVYVSFYKGIGGIAGAALAGPADFIAEARVWQRRHGGNLVQLYPYVIAAREGLRLRLPRFAGYHERAVRIAEALTAVPGIVVKPNPPQTNMMHVYLRGEPERLKATALTIAREDKVALFAWLAPTDLPDYWMFELSVGDAAEALTDEEITGYFRRVMEQ